MQNEYTSGEMEELPIVIVICGVVALTGGPSVIGAAYLAAIFAARYSPSLWEYIIPVTERISGEPATWDSTAALDRFVGSVFPALPIAVDRYNARRKQLLPAPSAQLPATHSSHSAISRLATATPILATTRRKTSAQLIEACVAQAHLGVIGATGAGKSTAMRGLIAGYRYNGATVVVIDPHAGPATWAADQVIGGGRDYSAIEASLNSAMEEMTTRYKAINNGDCNEGEFPRLVIMFDEWRAVAANIPNAGNILAMLLAEARKVDITIVLGTQSKNVAALFGTAKGTGDSNIRDCLVILQLTKTSDGTRRAYLEGVEYEPIAPDMVPMEPVQSGITERGPLRTSTELVPEPVQAEGDPLDAQIQEWAALGWTRNRIAKEIGGGRSKALDRITQVLGPSER